MRHYKRSILISGLMSMVCASLIVALSRYLGRPFSSTRRASTWPLATDPARSRASAPATMDKPFVFVDGGDPLPARLVERWQTEARRLNLAGWAVMGYVQMKADRYRHGLP